jgi:hypothetical protein
MTFVPNFSNLTVSQIVEQAKNLPSQNTSPYTLDMFQEDYPQFFKVVVVDNPTPPPPTIETTEPILPEHIMLMFIQIANSMVAESRWGIKWRYGMGLAIAHYATLYSKNYSQSTADGDPSSIPGGDAGDIENISSVSFGDVSVSFKDDTDSGIAAGQWGSFASTTYGTQLISEARLVSQPNSMYVLY